MSKLERTTHVLLILVSVAGLAAIVRQQFFPRTPPRARPELLGRRLAVPGLSLPSGSGLAVVVAERSDCHFCVESLPFYREVDGRRKAGNSHLSLFFISTEPVEKQRAFLEEAGIHPDGIISLDFSEIGVAATPTLAVIDSKGTVKRVFYGKLTERDGHDFLAKIEGPTL